MDYLKMNNSKIIFILLIVGIMSIGAGMYIESSSHFRASCDRICKAQEQLCQNLPISVQKTNKDSIIVHVRDIESVITSGNEKIYSMLQLQHAEVQEDFNNLMLWAAVLMVIFLVFSIYSMYKIDDLVNQSRNAVDRVTKLALEAELKIKDIDRQFKEESERLAEQSATEIESLKTASDEYLKNLDVQIRQKISDSEQMMAENLDKYNKAVDSKAQNVTKQFEELTQTIRTLVDFFRGLHPEK